MSETAKTTAAVAALYQPSDDEIMSLARGKMDRVPRSNDTRRCPICGDDVFFNVLVAHVLREHRDDLIFQIQQQRGNAK